jgi:ribulose-phosphate 3-epimerase
MKLIAPSILSADFSKLGDEVRAVEDAGADWIHVDVMDGHFVPNITMGPIVVEAVKKVTSLPVDVHLMIENPDRYIPDFISAGADWLSVQVEACVHLNRTIQMIREAGIRAGAVLNPATSLTTLEWSLELLDFALIMSVNPGFGGQAFIQNSLKKISDLRLMINDRNLATLIQVDGGVNSSTIESVSSAGADVFVAGSAIFGTDDYAGAISHFRALIENNGH